MDSIVESEIDFLCESTVDMSMRVDYMIDGDVWRYYLDSVYRVGYYGLKRRSATKAYNYIKKRASLVYKNGVEVPKDSDKGDNE